jgi:hypothetical protein
MPPVQLSDLSNRKHVDMVLAKEKYYSFYGITATSRIHNANFIAIYDSKFEVNKEMLKLAAHINSAH